MTKLIPETVFVLSKTNFRGTAENRIIAYNFIIFSTSWITGFLLFFCILDINDVPYVQRTGRQKLKYIT